MDKILIIEDDEMLNAGLCFHLEKGKKEPVPAYDLKTAESYLKKETYDLILLDVNLPDGEGFSFCRWIKSRKETPVIYLTARDMEEDVLTGYESGAEDYITKPFSMKILSRKIDVILKRTVLVSQLIFEDGYLSIDMDNVKVSVKGRECSVTPTECRLLRQFLLNRGQLLTYDLLLERLWDSGSQFVDRHALAVNINRLRGKIEDETHKYISNVYGMGYQWIG